MSINIRRFEVKDAESHFNAVTISYDSLKTWFSWAKPDYHITDSEKFIESQFESDTTGRYSYAIIDDSNANEILGSCGLRIKINPDDERVASMSYWCRKERQGEGITRKAAEKLIDKAFNELLINQIEIDVAHCNVASENIANKLGVYSKELTIQDETNHNKLYSGARYIVHRN
jgi:ribosomal-protein-serine acetyltransferase